MKIWHYQTFLVISSSISVRFSKFKNVLEAYNFLYTISTLSTMVRWWWWSTSRHMMSHDVMWHHEMTSRVIIHLPNITTWRHVTSWRNITWRHNVTSHNVMSREVMTWHHMTSTTTGPLLKTPYYYVMTSHDVTVWRHDVTWRHGTTSWRHGMTSWHPLATFGQEYWQRGHVAGGRVNAPAFSLLLYLSNM